MSDDNVLGNEEEIAPSEKGKVNKLLMGMVIGGAIGSVLGVTFAPKAGKQTRDYVKQKLLETSEKTRLVLGWGIENKKEKKTFFHVLNEFFSRKKKNDKN